MKFQREKITTRLRYIQQMSRGGADSAPGSFRVKKFVKHMFFVIIIVLLKRKECVASRKCLTHCRVIGQDTS